MDNTAIIAWINEQPTGLQPIFIQLRAMILEELPYIKEYISYQIPFYGHYRRICYLNYRHGAAELGLCQGAFLSNQENLLTGEGKQVRYVRINELKNIKQAAIRYILQEAILWDQLQNSQKKTIG